MSLSIRPGCKSLGGNIIHHRNYQGILNLLGLSSRQCLKCVKRRAVLVLTLGYRIQHGQLGFLLLVN